MIACAKERENQGEEWKPPPYEKSRTISRTIFLYCIAFFCTLLFIFILNDNALHCVLTLYDPNWNGLYIYAKGCVQMTYFTFLFYFISVASKYTKNLARFIVCFFIFFSVGCPVCAALAQPNEQIRLLRLLVILQLRKAFSLLFMFGLVLFSEPFLVLGQNQDMIYGFRLLFLTIFSLMWKWIRRYSLFSSSFSSPSLVSSSSGFSGAVERNVYISWNEITHEKFVVGVFLSIAFVTVIIVFTTFFVLLSLMLCVCGVCYLVCFRHGVHFVGGCFGVFLSKWYYMSSVVHCQFIWACLWFSLFSFSAPFSCILVWKMRVWKFLVRVITKIHIRTLQQSVNERKTNKEDEKKSEPQTERKKRETTAATRVQIAQSMKRSYAYTYTDNKKCHKNTRKTIKKLVSFVQFALEWQWNCGSHFALRCLIEDWALSTQHTIHKHRETNAHATNSVGVKGGSIADHKAFLLIFVQIRCEQSSYCQYSTENSIHFDSLFCQGARKSVGIASHLSLKFSE